MGKPWSRQKGETPKAFEAFGQYLKLGPKRSLAIVADAHHRGNVRKLETWSAKYGWVERVAAFDAEQLAKDMERREEHKERLRQELFDEASAALAILFGLLRGQVPADAATVAQLNKQGQVIGEIPIVKPGTLKEIIFGILDRIGLGPAKRVELTGRDGENIELLARHKLETLDTDTLVAIRDVLTGGDGK